MVDAQELDNSSVGCGYVTLTQCCAFSTVPAPEIVVVMSRFPEKRRCRRLPSNYCLTI